jgi:hypothetical protein
MGLLDFILRIIRRGKISELDEICHGDGTRECPVVINTKSRAVGISLEVAWIKRKYGLRNLDWKLDYQMTLRSNDGKKRFDIYAITLHSGEKKSIEFDITSFF